MSSWNPPQNYSTRPVAVLGAGVLGRRIACIWASAGYTVHVRDPSADQRAAATDYVATNVVSYAQKTRKTPGKVTTFEHLPEAVAKAWLVIEAVPEILSLKTTTFADLEKLAPEDCILASNSSSYKSSEMLGGVVSETTKSRILNMHYYMPPESMMVELMTDGYTDVSIFPFLVEKCREAGTSPYVARRESTGFIFNRLWAAIKREVMNILAEGVSAPEEIDAMWMENFVEGRIPPCRTMDKVGLDTVAFIERHYIQERGLPSEKTVDFLKAEYLDHGKLGNKSPKGGLYPSSETSNGHSEDKIIVLDLGLSAASPGLESGEILEMTTSGKITRSLVSKQALPDGLAVDKASGRMFWTCMGVPGKNDGAVYSANLDGSSIETLVAPGVINTPKQLALDAVAKKVYFADREGARIYRCSFDGSNLEVLIDNSTDDVLNWCVGIAVAPTLGLFFWTQKGPSKGGKGRIFGAPIAGNGKRQEIKCVLSDLPEPIDLEVDENSRMLYWTDRGEIPYGNSLNKIQLGDSGLLLDTQSTLCRHFKEAIGLKLDVPNGHVYVTDLGGNIYRCSLDGNKERVYSDDYRAFTGIAIV
ncbi:hypothetical protein ASPWEDRAFT_743804 [Aspergillus wentii DTO 134E9]|uniref:Uncharacterized protein n=1 Tax=Aspergillus wentii DTO 134E9 TaxID=1073089 RepID=A0A1L9RDD2_ASPWE|nr:uncharacterized protein ASPWEDRAFT_743804 [Aspergillus wentii DTO 134E9]KAI9933196.1 hypothetical protein MW887_007668 [Aspergillus wentii]OJJ32922.1 hypothetical protein ASPWEDRAFT_743804 [Aspergillus wentii DTO 134E9]